mmetsp:Transcript_44839/g.93480  ORF Transcript_44839/g.93480 Transcript_44839/m.93480 type:complete len:234 (+) Transcript_44839:112-813(+)
MPRLTGRKAARRPRARLLATGRSTAICHRRASYRGRGPSREEASRCAASARRRQGAALGPHHLDTAATPRCEHARTNAPTDVWTHLDHRSQSCSIPSLPRRPTSQTHPRPRSSNLRRIGQCDSKLLLATPKHKTYICRKVAGPSSRHARVAAQLSTGHHMNTLSVWHAAHCCMRGTCRCRSHRATNHTHVRKTQNAAHHCESRALHGPHHGIAPGTCPTSGWTSTLDPVQQHR